jgi:hypothetical protein
MVAMPGRWIIRIRIKIVSAAERSPAFVPKNLDKPPLEGVIGSRLALPEIVELIAPSVLMVVKWPQGAGRIRKCYVS